jgi:ADP-heptose:LPS heptosyltransferase
MNQIQIGEDSKCYILMLAGGLGARIIQTVFIRSLISKRKTDRNSWPIIVVDNSLIGFMVSEALNGHNIMGTQVPEPHQQWPQDPGIMKDEKLGQPEHPIFLDSWRKNFQQYATGSGSVNRLINNNWKRSYQIEYGHSLSKLIHGNKLKDSPKSFIGNHYGKVMDLKYDGGVPLLKRTQTNADLQQHLDKQDKPFVLVHMGVDRNPHEFMSGVNYRVHKVWSLVRWAQLAEKLKHKYNFIQVHANQYNPEIPGFQTVKVDNLNPVLQILEHPKCAFYMSIDNYLPHLAASLKKPGIVLWGSVSPYVWGWKHNINIWNKTSCPDIACWRPGPFDTDENGKIWICDHYSCMKSIELDQVLAEVGKMEKLIGEEPEQRMISL